MCLSSFSWETRWTVSSSRCVRPCSGRWSLKPSRPWISPACSAPAATATCVPSRPAAPRTTTASPSSPCRAPREASRAGPVSAVWCTSAVSLRDVWLSFYVVATWWETQWEWPVGEGILWQLESAYLDKRLWHTNLTREPHTRTNCKATFNECIHY